MHGSIQEMPRTRVRRSGAGRLARPHQQPDSTSQMMHDDLREISCFVLPRIAAAAIGPVPAIRMATVGAARTFGDVFGKVAR